MQQDVREYGVDADIIWVPGHQTKSSFWQAGNEEAHRRSTVHYLTSVVWLPAESPAAAAKSLSYTGASDAVRHLSAVAALLRRQPQYRPNLVTLLSPGPAAADAQELAKVPRILPVFFKPPPKPSKDKILQLRQLQHLPAPLQRHGAALGMCGRMEV
jgi:hypothetical protein